MLGREAALAKSQCEALRRISKDWVDVASSFEGEDAARSVRDLNHPPSMKKTARTVGIALAVAPEPFTTVAGVALVAGSFVMKGEPMAVENVTEELGDYMSEMSAFDLGALTISFP